MPFLLRDAYSRMSAATSEPARAALQRQTRQLRLKWVSDLRKQALQNRVYGGGVVCRSKKLFPVEAFVVSDSSSDGTGSGCSCLSQDRNRWKLEVQNHFGAQWGARRPENRMRILDYVLKHDGSGPDFSPEVWSIAAAMIKRSSRCDHYGVSVDLLKLLMTTQPDSTAFFFNSLLKNTPQMALIEVHGSVFGKASSSFVIQEKRAILPQPAILQVIDAAISAYWNKIIDVLVPQPFGVFVGARPNTRALDIAHSLQLVIECGLDQRS